MAEGVRAIIIEGRYIYKPLLLKTCEWEYVLYIKASLKEFVVKSKQNKYKIVKRNNSNDLDLRLLREEIWQLNKIKINKLTAASINKN